MWETPPPPSGLACSPISGVDLDYVEVAEPPLLEPTRALTPASRVLAAWRVEGVRLIDNRAIGGADG